MPLIHFLIIYFIFIGQHQLSFMTLNVAEIRSSDRNLQPPSFLAQLLYS